MTGAFSRLFNDLYVVNRDLAAWHDIKGGEWATSWDNNLSHTFTAYFDDTGKLIHTYSWGNDANLQGWNLDQPEDMTAAVQSLNAGMAVRVAPTYLGPYYDKAFRMLDIPSNQHLNYFVFDNCKTETVKLNNLAWDLYKKAQ